MLQAHQTILVLFLELLRMLVVMPANVLPLTTIAIQQLQALIKPAVLRNGLGLVMVHPPNHVQKEKAQFLPSLKN